MELNECVPNIRFADTLLFEFQRGPSRTYDGRLLYGVTGAAEVDIGGKTYVLSRGSLLLFQSNTEYTIRPKRAVTLSIMDFDFTQEYSQRTEYLLPCPSELFDMTQAHPHISFSDAPVLDEPFFLKNASFLEGMIQEILREFQEKRLFFRGKTSTLFMNLLFELARADQMGANSRDTVPRILEFIEDNIARRISNTEIGEALNYNPNYLNRLMMQHTGMSLHQYILKRRLTIAATLLLTTRQPIGEIAVELGFNSPSHFSNLFKQEMGMTPNCYRQQSNL